MADAPELPDDLLPLHIAALRADRAMTTAREQGGDVDAAREEYVTAALALRAHPIWEQGRQDGQHHKLWQASLDAAKAALDGESTAA
ncbi:hypothetical protein KV557_09825 [Kitasatospora aureofaciens]|uniref:hypothetical protein n=1 Tax=Kitasatospora aureofaciens TaxID=1894 RepID=UPI001C46A9D4|nr:hypothetical protein [Kitasatospora aureofaciens]MBV6697421.1 hypothetical protein [Kitasatospora aureofaciens]